MSNPALDISLGAPDPTASPLTVVELFALIDSHLTGEILGDYSPYIIRSTTPSIEDTDKVWIQTDGSGRPIATKLYYAGNWRRVYNGMIGEIRIYSGSPNNIIVWDSDGRGQPGKEYDGWQICNGKNGSPNLTDKFIVAAHMDQSNSQPDYSSGGWRTSIEDPDSSKHTGGRREFTLDEKTAYEFARDAITARRSLADGNAPDPGGTLLGTGSSPTQYTLNGGEAAEGHLTPDPVNIINPYIAMGYIVFIGYA